MDTAVRSEQLILCRVKHGPELYGKIIGRSFARAEMPDVIDRLLETYVAERRDDERFVDTVHRVGLEPFKTNVYRERDRVAAD